MKVMKFGGSSVGTPERIKRVIEIVRDSLVKEPVAVVVSAFQGVTDELSKIAHLGAVRDEQYASLLEELRTRHEDAAKELLSGDRQVRALKIVAARMKELSDVFHGVFLVKELSPRVLDFALSFGEQLSAYLIAKSFQESGVAAEFLDSRSLVKTDSSFGAARVQFDKTCERIRTHFEAHPALQVITGFIGSTDEDETTTLGRGGSDYSASLFGAALSVKEIEIWTDVDGVMTADPRKVKNAFAIPSMTYEEAMEMSHFGAKIIHAPTMQPARKQKIPIRIKNAFHPEHSGTLVSDTPSETKFVIRGISSIPNVALLTVQGSGMVGISGISSRLFGALSKRNISVILITQASSEHSICLAVDPKAANQARKAIQEEFSLEMYAGQIDEVILEQDLCIMAVVGERMRHTPGIAARLFTALGNSGVNVVAIAQGSSELNISIVIAKKDEETALNAVHATFFQ